MADGNEAVVESVEPVNTPEPSAPIPAPSEPAQEAAPQEKAAVAPPVYTPDYKLKVMDEEKEVPEAFRSLMKDEKTAKEIREVFEKSFGHEHVKPKYEALKTNFTQLQSEHNSLTGHVGELRELYNRNDMDAFFKKLAIPEEKILQYALEKVNYQELPAEQKAALDSRRNTERQNWELQRQNQFVQQQFQEQVVQARRQSLDFELARPEVKSIADSYDQRVNSKGAFLREVINRGQLAWFQSQGKIDLQPGQAVEEVIKAYGLRGAPESATHTPTSPDSGAAPKTPTIPNVGSGKSTAPLKQKPRSIDDLKKIAAQM